MFAIGAVLFFIVVGIAFAAPLLSSKSQMKGSVVNKYNIQNTKYNKIIK